MFISLFKQRLSDRLPVCAPDRSNADLFGSHLIQTNLIKMNKPSQKNVAKKHKEASKDASNGLMDTFLSAETNASQSTPSPPRDLGSNMASTSPDLHESMKRFISEALNAHTSEICQKIDGIASGLLAVNNRVDDLETAVSIHEQSMTRLESRVTTALNSIENRILTSECYSRKRNLLLHGITESSKEDTDLVVRRFFVEVLHLPEADVNTMLFVNVHRLPRMPKPNGTPFASPTPVIVKFVRVPDREWVLRSARKNGARLREGKYSVITDLPPSLKFLRSQLSRKAAGLRNNNNLHARVFERGTELTLQYRKNKDTIWINLGIDEEPKV